MTETEQMEQLITENKMLKETLREIAMHLTSDEGDDEETEQFFGLSIAEIIEMAHDEMILQARQALGMTVKHEETAFQIVTSEWEEE